MACIPNRRDKIIYKFTKYPPQLLNMLNVFAKRRSKPSRRADRAVRLCQLDIKDSEDVSGCRAACGAGATVSSAGYA